MTIVFSDLKGSTSLGEALDSEALREVMTRYFDAMRGELERHGGVIEKFIGDAVMAVFGLPRLHEDDALRAVRAAAGMQAALEELNASSRASTASAREPHRRQHRRGRRGRPDDGQRLVTGDAVNVAARLEQAAGEREVLLGGLTYRLVRDRVDVEEVEPLDAQGEVRAGARVSARRASARRATESSHGTRRSSAGDASSRSLESTLRRGRRDAVRPARDDRRRRRGRQVAAHRGVRSSARRPRARARGPVPSVRRRHHVLADRRGDPQTQAGIGDEDDATEARAKLAALADDAGDGVTDRLASAIGLDVEPFPVEEVFWAVRRLVERLARGPPSCSSSRTSTGRSRRCSA